MNKRKHARVATLSLVGRTIRLLAGPITLLIISKQLSSAEVAFYYTFFSVISMQQLAELGMGHVIKQYISHAYKLDIANIWTKDSKLEIRKYFYFSMLWFLGVSVFVLIIVGLAGYYYFSLSTSSISWQGAWLGLVVASAISTFLSPIQFFIDGIQQQEKLLFANIISSFVNAFALWACLIYGAGLYSISISLFLSTLALYVVVFPTFKYWFKKIKIDNNKIDYKSVLMKILPLLSKVSLVWGLGFLFWNGFNLVSFSSIDVNDAGKIIFAIALARAGFGIAESITQGQTTIFSNLISENKYVIARSEFSKYCNISMCLLVVGYALFYLVWYLFPSFYIFNKIPSKLIVFEIFVFFIIQLYKTLRTNFIRNFKVEPFVKPSIFEALSLPIVFYIGIKFNVEIAFVMSILVIVIGFIWALWIEKKFIGSNVNAE